MKIIFITGFVLSLVLLGVQERSRLKLEHKLASTKKCNYGCLLECQENVEKYSHREFVECFASCDPQFWVE